MPIPDDGSGRRVVHVVQEANGLQRFGVATRPEEPEPPEEPAQ